MPKRSGSAVDGTFLSRLRSGRTLWLAAAALFLPMALGSCVITDSDDLSTSIVVCFDGDGFTAVISLERPVRLPLDEDDAYYVMTHCSCACYGDLVRVRDYWQYPEYPGSPGCFIRIHVYTGDVECFQE